MVHFSVKALCLLGGLCALPQAYAACTLINGATAGSLNVSFGVIPTFNPGSATNVQVATRSFTAATSASAMGIGGSTVFVNCTAGESLVWGDSSYARLAGSPGYLKTGIDNLYMNLTTTPGTTSAFAYPTTGGGNFTRTFSTINFGDPRWSDIGGTNVFLRKVGRISQGGVVPGGILAVWRTSDSKTLLTLNLSSFTVNVLGCAVTTPTVSVPMGTVHRVQFKGVGSTVGNASFSIGMNCDTAISPTVTFSGMPDSNAPGTVLELNNLGGGTTASGVGVQMVYKGTPVTLNSAVSLGTTTSAGLLTMDLNARYYQTASVITGGEANATAYFTIDYE
ncbi:fimbrial protein [Serratia fonticola]|uniref:fimbrial protein n=1 Tax=Serratia fonticola TaxID=47917 RepID=UPI00192D0351|nr:fimbrial protein [Serratia fonticola]MBL5825954.1 fimbrial protein [Serratia fonticola]